MIVGGRIPRLRDDDSTALAGYQRF